MKLKDLLLESIVVVRTPTPRHATKEDFDNMAKLFKDPSTDPLALKANIDILKNYGRKHNIPVWGNRPIIRGLARYLPEGLIHMIMQASPNVRI